MRRAAETAAVRVETRPRPMAAPEHPGPPAAVLPPAGRSADGDQPRQLRGPAGDPDQAAAELVLLDHDFYLFTERSAGQDSVIYRTPDGYRLAMAHPKPGRQGPLPGSVTVSPLPASSRAATPRVRLTLLGVGATNSPRFAPAGLLVRCGDAAVAIDGGPGAEPPGAVDAWLVTDEHAELRAALRRLARARDMPAPAVAEHVTGTLAVRPFPVEHTSHPAYGYRISAGGQIAVWAPEFWRFPCWADRADLLFAEAAGWDRPIPFRGGVGGHASVAQVATEAARRGVRRMVYAHIGRPSLRAMDAGLQPPFGEWGAEGKTCTVAG